MLNLRKYDQIIKDLQPYNATLVAVSKKKSIDDINTLFDHGQKQFGENYVQELVNKQNKITGAEWHFIGHLQSNKVKHIAPFCSLIHGIDSFKLLQEVNKQAIAVDRVQPCLLQIHVGKEESKFGLSITEAENILQNKKLDQLKNITVNGLMGITTLTDDDKIIRNEFKILFKLFSKYKSDNFSILSMGMTNDYIIALEEGSNMVRIGSAIFGERT